MVETFNRVWHQSRLRSLQQQRHSSDEVDVRMDGPGHAKEDFSHDAGNVVGNVVNDA